MEEDRVAVPTVSADMRQKRETLQNQLTFVHEKRKSTPTTIIPTAEEDITPIPDWIPPPPPIPRAVLAEQPRAPSPPPAIPVHALSPPLLVQPLRAPTPPPPVLHVRASVQSTADQARVSKRALPPPIDSTSGKAIVKI